VKVVRAVPLLICLWLSAEPSSAAPIIAPGSYSLGPTFVVPIDITNAADLITWQFDLAFDPSAVQVNVACDASADAFCDVITGPVTAGPFTEGPFSLFVPGVIDNTNGLLTLVAGGFGGPPPGRSGDGTLAYVEFIRLTDSDPNIRVTDSITSTPPVPEPTTVLLVASGAAAVGLGRGRRRGRKP
jgi:hypothetical protein